MNKNEEEKHEKRCIRKEKRKVHKKRRKIINLIIAGGLTALIIGVFIYVWPQYAKIKENMYDILANMNETTFMQYGNTEIYDKEGNLIGSLGNEEYEYIEISDISEYVTKGYIAKEDNSFYTHPGIDVKAIVRATIALIKNKGKITQGGSTITQQVVKNNLLTQEQTYLRKITEIMIALELEKRYDKAKIMEFYCNSNYYGNGCYGIEGAAQYYFGVSSKNMTLSQAAMMVATSNSPNNYNPVVDYDLCLEKRDIVLGKMLELNYITKEEYQRAKDEEPKIVQKSKNVNANNYMVTYALNDATLKIMETDGFEFKYTFESEEEYEAYKEHYNNIYNQTYEKVTSSGYTIKTSFDNNVQAKLQNNISEGLDKFNKSKNEDGLYKLQGAGICIDNNTGLVIAAVGGRESSGNMFNRSYQAKRQPGSAIKPLLDYGPAINEGYVTPGSILKDESYEVNGYEPENSNKSYIGKVSIRDALARSINTVALQLFDGVGREKCLEYLSKLKFSTLTYADSTIYTISLGGFTQGVTLKDIASGYGTLAAEGKQNESSCIKEITDHTNKVIYKYKRSNTQIYTQDTAFMLTDMMQGVIKEDYGTASMYNSAQKYAVKTGTTNDNRDSWFCGYSKYYTTVTWMGYDTPKEMEGITGAKGAGSIWYSFMEELHQGLTPIDFSVPETIYLKKGDKTKHVTYCKNTYESRPLGWDYASRQLIEANKENQEKLNQKKIIKKAKKEVSKFEGYKILTVEDAKGLEKKYEQIITLIEKITDTDIREALMNRVAMKYESLSGEVKNEWQKVIDAQEEININKTESDYDADAQESKEAAYELYKSKLITNAKWYIKEIKRRKLYTENVEALITDGYNAVEMCAGLDEYNELLNQYTAAKEYAYTLPESSGEQEIYEINPEDYAD